MSQDTAVRPLKMWLRIHLRRALRDALDVLALRMISDRQLPARGSDALYRAHMRRLGSSEQDRRRFDRLWQERRQL